MHWRINFYHTESQYRAGLVTFSLERSGSREAVAMEARNLARSRGDYTFEVEKI